MRLSNFQIVGSVNVSADKNSGLKDQSNREGIVSSQAFTDFKEVIKELLSKIEERRDTYRRGNEVTRVSPSIFEALSLEPVKDVVAKKYPGDKELLGFIDEQARSIDHSVTEVQKVISRYRRLATLGQLIDVILHDGRTPIAKIQNKVELLRLAKTEDKTIKDTAIFKALERIESATEFLNGLINRLSPFSGRKRGRPAQTTIENIVLDSFDFFKKPIENSMIKVILPSSKTPVTLDEVEIKEILINLIDNSIYWLEKVPPEKRRIEVKINKFDDRLEIIFADSGPGVEEEYVNRIFDPYFSSKPDGIGLGLTIAGEAAAEYDGNLELMGSDALPGATFRVTLRKRIGGD
jgi:C4-dicarboxylate-specific signal transduction histidine kinase